MHTGVDLAARQGTHLVATADGTIVKIEKDRFLGNFIEIWHNEKFSTLYGHMKAFAEGMEQGTRVKRGDVIGYMGKTGRTTGTHVHYEVKLNGESVNPMDYILD